MSTIIEILRETEVILPATIVEALHRERREQHARASRQSGQYRARAPHPDTAFANARDTDMGRPEVRVVGRAPQPARPVQSAKSKIVPEPDQGKSERPGSRPVTGPLEPRG